jgi:hypothetical protein
MSRLTAQQERALADGLAALARTSRHAAASGAVEAAVLAAMQGQRPAPRTNPAWLPIAAALLLAVGAGVWASRAQAPARPAPIVPAGFIGLPGAAALPPLESGAIVRVAVPVAALPSYGMQIVPDLGSDRVEVDLLVAQDGLPRAIRFADDTHTARSTP